MSNGRIRVAVDKDPFAYDMDSKSLVILGRTDAKVRMELSDVPAFCKSIVSIKENRYKMVDKNIQNNANELRRHLSLEGYVKLDGTLDCEVWGVFHDTIENILMLEIVYPTKGSRHINVALDLDKWY